MHWQRRRSTGTSRWVILVLVPFLLLVSSPSLVDARKEKATGIVFPEKTAGNPLFGVGVRTKGPIKVYGVGCYGPKGVQSKLSAFDSPKDKKAAQTLLEGVQKGPATFILKFNFKVNAEKVSTSLTDAVSSRSNLSKDLNTLRTLLCDGVNTHAGGVVKKGNSMTFNCSSKGIDVALDGKHLGTVPSGGLAKAFCAVFLDNKTVSPSLKQSCLDSCCGSNK